ncbi:hypothetical protein IOD16_10710 [Saccharothrix sp. 6-C]|uniref:FXSXX-COOH protein n=1 Tax=Saccharothrix texasensis TaxID=103734 RepID=A0A3N1H1P9_9PSEU|nr:MULTISPECIES: hypothetical protein [Saccharothrix]QQQ78854.1 hypothetical protein IOD16_10710 [Saccharothrix sp. 6-C]ROP36437.1 FXSXX-COOH protein [Saccharothrix texasensis]
MSDPRDDIEVKIPDVTAVPLRDLAAIPVEALSEALRPLLRRSLVGAEVQEQADDDWPPEESSPRR